ncbi:hypothetical protein [Lentzea sp. NPDC004782]|uniref:hypothetical protein n=1 Tax=Lentzea sp. NPDC004782 TaxID=3154458 RepID=UPI0033BB295A
MLKKLFIGATLACAALAVAAPAASASTVNFGGVYPTFEAARDACQAGIDQGRWFSCYYETPAPGPQTYLWVESN